MRLDQNQKQSVYRDARVCRNANRTGKAATSGLVFVRLALVASVAASLSLPIARAAAGSERNGRLVKANGNVQGWTPRVEARASGGAGELVVNGQVVLRLRTSQAGLTPDLRAQIAAERLKSAIDAGLKPSDVTVDAVSDKANPRLKVNGQTLATSSADEARGGSSSPAGLATDWAGALRRALAVPGLSVSDSDVLVPLGETRTVRIGGAARGPISVSLGAAGGGENNGSPQPAAATVDQATGAVDISGAARGRDTLTITREGASVTMNIAVQPYAGRFNAANALTVTGANVPAELIARYAAATAINSGLPNPGASARITAETMSVSPLASGQTQAVTVPVTLTGPEMIPVSRNVRVAVTNTALPPVSTGVLFYSNNPERLSAFGTLFVGRLPNTLSATRLLYHHQSAMERALWFTVELINDRDQPASVQVVGGGAGPVRDTVWVGYRTASDFVRSYLADTGAVIQIPPHARVGLTATRMGPGLTISGLLQLRRISGPAPLVRVAADIPGGELSLPGELQAYPTDWNERDAGQTYALSEHVYPNPTKTVRETYRAGGRWTFVSIGREPLASANSDKRRLEGNYGVFYDMTFQLENPTAQSAKARIVFEPSAGLAGGVFLVDGKYIEIPQMNLPKEAVLGAYTLAPGEKRTVTVKTLPLSGSNYPATIVVRP